MSIEIPDSMNLPPDDLRRIRLWLDRAECSDDPSAEVLADWLERGELARDAARVERALAADSLLLAALLAQDGAAAQAPTADEVRRARNLVADRRIPAASGAGRTSWREPSGWRHAFALTAIVAVTGIGWMLGDELAASHWQQEQRALSTALFGTAVDPATGDMP